MGKDRDPTSQVGSRQELHWEMERTRQSMSETVDEIKGNISHALQWQTYLRKYPGAFLIGGGALGFIVGLAITRSGYPRKIKNVHEQAAAFDNCRERDRSPGFSSKDSSIQRVIDMTVSALLAQVLPIVSSKLRDLLGSHAVEGGSGDSPSKDSWLH